MMQGDWKGKARIELSVKLHDHMPEIADILCYSKHCCACIAGVSGAEGQDRAVSDAA